MLYERSYNFTAGETIIADQIDDELNGIRTVLNGNIEADNIKDASITTDKLDASLNPTTRTAETIGDMVVSGLELQTIKGLTGTWTNKDEVISNGVVYMDGTRIAVTGGSKTFGANTTTYVVAKDTGSIEYESTLSLGYNNIPLYEVVTDGTKITSATPLAWGLIGTVIPYAGKSAPTGYLVCQGGEFSRTTYPKLFNVIQNFFGVPSGATVFKVPDLRAKAVYGFGDPTHYTVFGARGGTVTHTHGGVDHLHYHDHTHSTGVNIYTNQASNTYSALTSNSPPAHYHNTGGGSTAYTSGADRALTTAAGSDVAPYITLLYIIKAI
jgi:microcystin-dependent protein